MNSKVAAVWIIVIIVLVVIGIIGAANQDLLVKDDKKEEPIFIKLPDSTNCKKQDDAKNVVYSFGKDKLTISYDLVYPSHELFVAASNICGTRNGEACTNKLSGVKMILKGEETDFVFILDVDPTKVKTTELDKYKESLEQLEIVISNETDFAKYQELLPVKDEVKYECQK